MRCLLWDHMNRDCDLRFGSDLLRGIPVYTDRIRLSSWANKHVFRRGSVSTALDSDFVLYTVHHRAHTSADTVPGKANPFHRARCCHGMGQSRCSNASFQPQIQSTEQASCHQDFKNRQWLDPYISLVSSLSRPTRTAYCSLLHGLSGKV